MEDIFHLSDETRRVFKEAVDKEGSWLDKMKAPDNIDDAVSLIIGLIGYYGGAFCVDKETFIKKFSFLGTKEENILPLYKKLRCEGIILKRIKMASTLDKLERDLDYNIYILY